MKEGQIEMSLLRKTATIYHKGTILYGDDGEYKLLNKTGNTITYLYTPYKSRSVYDMELRKMDIRDLSDLLKVYIIWAVW